MPSDRDWEAEYRRRGMQARIAMGGAVVVLALACGLFFVGKSFRSPMPRDIGSYHTALVWSLLLGALGLFGIVGAFFWRKYPPPPDLPTYGLPPNPAPMPTGDPPGELANIALCAHAQARKAAGSAARWRRLRWQLGVPATLLAGSAGVASLKSASEGWVAAGALLGSGIVALSTAIDPGKNEQGARAAVAKLESIAARARIMPDADWSRDSETSKSAAVRDLSNELWAEIARTDTALANELVPPIGEGQPPEEGTGR